MSESLYSTAIHESAHLVIARVLGYPVFTVTLDDWIEGGGRVHIGTSSTTVEGCLHGMIIFLAAAAALRSFSLDPSPDEGDGSDTDKVRALARKIVGLRAGEEEIQAVIIRAAAAAGILVEQHRAEVERVSLAILEFHAACLRIKIPDPKELEKLFAPDGGEQ